VHKHTSTRVGAFFFGGEIVAVTTASSVHERFTRLSTPEESIELSRTLGAAGLKFGENKFFDDTGIIAYKFGMITSIARKVGSVDRIVRWW
jgi:hypothetical protein